MEYLVVCTTALIASGLTLFSGFGLGTLLLPAFAMYFPIPAAVGMTAVVHLLNNLFKLALVGRFARRDVVVKFGVPAIVASIAGAWLLVTVSELSPLATYEWRTETHRVTVVGVVIAVLMIAFALVEMLPRFQKMAFDTRYLPLGGALSGFFGGLSGHQGALRSAFLLKSGLSRDAFVGTGVVIACVVDITRLGVYGSRLQVMDLRANWPVMTAAVLAAFVGAFLGARILGKVSMRSIQVVVSVMLVFIAFGLGLGVF